MKSETKQDCALLSHGHVKCSLEDHRCSAQVVYTDSDQAELPKTLCYWLLKNIAGAMGRDGTKVLKHHVSHAIFAPSKQVRVPCG